MYLCGIGLPWAYWSSYFSFPQNLPDGTNFLYQPITWAQSVYKRRWKSLMRSKDLEAESGIFEKIYLPTIYCTCAKEGYIRRVHLRSKHYKLWAYGFAYFHQRNYGSILCAKSRLIYLYLKVRFQSWPKNAISNKTYA